MIQFSRLTPKSEKVLTGGVGLLSQKDLDEFDTAVRCRCALSCMTNALRIVVIFNNRRPQVDRIVNTACHETTRETIPNLLRDFRERRLEYFKALHSAVYKKVRGVRM